MRIQIVTALLMAALGACGDDTASGSTAGTGAGGGNGSGGTSSTRSSGSGGSDSAGQGGAGGFGSGAGGGASGVGGGGGTGGAVLTPSPFDWLGIIGTGQSLSVGAAGMPVISTRQPYGNLKLFDASPAPQYDGVDDQLSLVPLTAPIRPSDFATVEYPNNVFGETPNEGMANQMSALTLARGGFDTVSVHTNVGESGQGINVIAKGGSGRAYAATLYEVSAIRALADAAGKTYGIGAIVLTHGETDATNPNYAAGLEQLLADYQADLTAITGQPQPIPMLISQQSTVPSDTGSIPGSAQAVWRLGVDSPGQFLVTGPKYQYEYADDKIHLFAAGYRRLGEKYGEIFVRAVLGGEDWKPLQPRAAQLEGTTITVDFDVPDPPLAWEETIPAPHQNVFTEWAAGRGFEVFDANGRQTITSVAIQGASVVIELAAPPSLRNLVVGYAMTHDAQGLAGGEIGGRAGQLRDSDDFVGYSATTIGCNVEQGSTTITAQVSGSFDTRGRKELVDGSGLPNGAVVMTKSGDVMTLSAPWEGPSGAADLGFLNDHRNYAVHFYMPVPSP